ncbi:hypothetical protein MBVG596_0590 [Mycoplasmopsis bovigenitalium]|uniref:hypothetical protein n=1 Tax=Mycoplasmopsis bovigenitalium TaxID=2112 RepID=UPI0009096511|nr:hypothetical protein [Mycoplasmopsis bovigenitalium]BAW18293.1 hypothetical protein MBVG596_0590 [Mycoplasmopsis bovigenitalium]
MISKSSTKFLIFENPKKDAQKFTLEDANLESKTNFNSIQQIVEEINGNIENVEDARIFIVHGKKIIGSLSVQKMGELVNKLTLDGINQKNQLSHIIDNKLYDKEHELVFVDPKKWRVINLILFAALLMSVVILLVALMYTGYLPKYTK